MTDINSKINQTIIRLKRNRMLKDSFWALLGNLIGKDCHLLQVYL